MIKYEDEPIYGGEAYVRVVYDSNLAGSLTFSVSDLPPGISYDPTTGEFSGAALRSAVPRGGSPVIYNATITVSAGTETESVTVPFTILDNTFSVETPGTLISHAGETVFFAPTLSYTQGNFSGPLMFSYENLPSGLSFDAQSGAIFGTPQPSVVPGDQSYTVSLVVTDVVTGDVGHINFIWLLDYYEPEIDFLEYELSSRNSEDNLLSGPTLIDIAVRVRVQFDAGATPTGTVTFRAIYSDGGAVELGTVEVGPNGMAVLFGVDCSLLAQPGVEVEAEYSGDALVAAGKKKDGKKTAGDLLADPPVLDNPAIQANAQNLTVVVIAGNGAERRRWRDSARAYYGAGAYLITNVHSVADLARELANLPPGSVSHLVIGGHGRPGRIQLDPITGRGFDLQALRDDPQSRATIQRALAENALVDLQGCSTALDVPGQQQNPAQALADLLGVRVRGSRAFVGPWDDGRVEWVVFEPQQ